MGPETNPTKNKKLSVLFCFETSVAFTMPLMPANRPLPTKNNITAKPIIIPPKKADCGVKFTIFILISPYTVLNARSKSFLISSKSSRPTESLTKLSKIF